MNCSNLPGRKISLLILGEMFSVLRNLLRHMVWTPLRRAWLAYRWEGQDGSVSHTSLQYWTVNCTDYWLRFLTDLLIWCGGSEKFLPNCMDVCEPGMFLSQINFQHCLVKAVKVSYRANRCNIIVEEFAKEVLSETTFPCGIVIKEWILS